MITRSALLGIVDRLYRWRWWLSAALVGGYLALNKFDAVTTAMTGVLFALMLLLVWVPAMVRWFFLASKARTAFSEGYTDTRSP